MLGNDISNYQSPYVMFDIDSLLFLEEDNKKVWTKLTDMFKSDETKTLSQDINKDFAHTINRVWNKHNVSIGFVTFEIVDTLRLSNLLQEKQIPYTRIFKYEEWEELRNYGLSIYTFSNNLELLSFLSSKSALPINRLWEVL